MHAHQEIQQYVRLARQDHLPGASAKFAIADSATDETRHDKGWNDEGEANRVRDSYPGMLTFAQEMKEVVEIRGDGSEEEAGEPDQAEALAVFCGDRKRGEGVADKGGHITRE